MMGFINPCNVLGFQLVSFLFVEFVVLFSSYFLLPFVLGYGI